MSFDSWMQEVDLLCWAWFSMSIHDLPDMCFRDAFEDGLTPEDFMRDGLNGLEQLAHHICG